MFIGLVPEHIPLATQRSGIVEPGSSAPTSAQHTCVLGSHRVLPQKMPDGSGLVTSGLVLPESFASGFEVLAPPAPTSGRGPDPSVPTAAPPVPPMPLAPVVVDADVIDVIDVVMDVDVVPLVALLPSDASRASCSPESTRNEASSMGLPENSPPQAPPTLTEQKTTKPENVPRISRRLSRSGIAGSGPSID